MTMSIGNQTKTGKHEVKKIRVFEAFSGIGAQATALTRLNASYEIVGISEWFINALLGYSALHCPVDHKLKKMIEKQCREVLENELAEFSFSKDSVVPLESLNRLSDDELRQLYYAHKISKNVGSIKDVDPVKMPDMDLLVYSFPCQDLSTGGNAKGMKRNSGTRSSLLWEIERILKGMKKENRLPKYLVLENVKYIKAPRYKDDFKEWLDFLESLGYKNAPLQILNAQDFGIPQKRERAFLISSLEHEIESIEDRIEALKIDRKQVSLLDFLRMDYQTSNLRHEADLAQLNATPSRLVMWDLNGYENDELTPGNHVWTITCNFDRTQTSAMFRYSGPKGDTFRLLTNREAFLLMGFKDGEYDKVHRLGLSFRKENKLIGNSIVVNVLKAIFKVILEDWELQNG